jgi:hypothetical protein
MQSALWLGSYYRYQYHTTQVMEFCGVMWIDWKLWGIYQLLEFILNTSKTVKYMTRRNLKPHGTVSMLLKPFVIIVTLIYGSPNLNFLSNFTQKTSPLKPN